MLRAIAGDIIGSAYGRGNHKGKDFDLFSAASAFTDDTVLSVAVAEVILNGGSYAQSFAHSIKRYAQAYPAPAGGGYGKSFTQWAATDSLAPYNSWGNGSAMRVSPVGFACGELSHVLSIAQETANATHNHPEGIKGAQATAAAIFLARTGKSKAEIKSFIENTFAYDLSRSLASIQPTYTFDVSCQGSVPESIIAFLESTDFEDAIRNAVSLGGDTDTMACIAGAIAEAFYGEVPATIAQETLRRLDEPLRKVTLAFCDRYSVTYPFAQTPTTH